MVFLLIWAVGIVISLFRRRYRHAISNIIAIVIIPCFVFVAVGVPIFDPWLWYVIFNESGLKTSAADRLNAQQGPQLMIMEQDDVSTGFAGASPGHLVEIIYSQSDLDGWTTNDTVTRHLYGNFYRRDQFF